MNAALFEAPIPPPVAGVDLRCADALDVARSLTGVGLVHADPPWLYDNAAVSGSALAHYGGLDVDAIAAHLDATYDAAAPDCYLLVWATWPKLAEWMDVHRRMRWRYVSGGDWHKTGRMGIGFHWRGDCEPLLMYVKGSPRPLGPVSNAHASERRAHSEKPVPWLRDLVRTFCPLGGTVLDIYAGLAPLARACAAEGRHYVGAEIDPQRHADALALLRRSVR